MKQVCILRLWTSTTACLSPLRPLTCKGAEGSAKRKCRPLHNPGCPLLVTHACGPALCHYEVVYPQAETAGKGLSVCLVQYAHTVLGEGFTDQNLQLQSACPLSVSILPRDAAGTTRSGL